MFGDFSTRLLFITNGCREDMHEPDEQGVSVMFTGLSFDNAMGDDPYNNCQEMTIGITNINGETEWFNLASLIALARIGAKHIGAKHDK